MSFGTQSITDAVTASQDQTASTSTSLRPFSNLDLSEQQRTQIRSIVSNAKAQGLSQSDVQSQINAVLTPAQQQTFASDVQTARSAHSGHHHHHGGGSGAASSDQSQTASASTSALSNGLTETDIQNQVQLAQTLQLQQVQNDVLNAG